MDDTETDDFEPAEPTHSATWLVAATCGAIVLLIVTGGVFAMRDRLLTEAREESHQQTTAREKLSTRIDTIQATLDGLSAQPKAAGDTTELNEKLADVTSKLDALTARMDALEKAAAEKKQAPAPIAAPQPAPIAPHPSIDLATLKLAALSGKNFTPELAAWNKLHPETLETTAALSSVAESGIQSEATLNRQLREALDMAIAKTTVDDVSLAGKINTHLAGLVSIKKSGDAGPYATLRRDVLREDIPTLTHSVEALDDTARKPLAAWLQLAHARSAALAALAALDTQ